MPEDKQIRDIPTPRPSGHPIEERGINLTTVAAGLAVGLGTGAGQAIVGHLTKPKDPPQPPDAPSVILPPGVEGDE